MFCARFVDALTQVEDRGPPLLGPAKKIRNVSLEQAHIAEISHMDFAGRVVSFDSDYDFEAGETDSLPEAARATEEGNRHTMLVHAAVRSSWHPLGVFRSVSMRLQALAFSSQPIPRIAGLWRESYMIVLANIAEDFNQITSSARLGLISQSIQ